VYPNLDTSAANNANPFDDEDGDDDDNETSSKDNR
jgi:hypothetical protein